MTGMLIWVIRLIVILLVIRFVLRLFAGRNLPGRTTTRRETLRQGGTLVRDPQCGTYIPEAGALTVNSSAGRLHFCSTTCRDAWLAAPAGDDRLRSGAGRS